MLLFTTISRKSPIRLENISSGCPVTFWGKATCVKRTILVFLEAEVGWGQSSMLSVKQLYFIWTSCSKKKKKIQHLFIYSTASFLRSPSLEISMATQQRQSVVDECFLCVNPLDGVNTVF